MSELLVSAGRVIDAGGDAAGWLLARDGVWVERGTGQPPRSADLVLDTVLPPFVDVHCHGAQGIDFARLDTDPTPAIEHHRAHGSTTLMATIATGSRADMRDRIRELSHYVHVGALAGIHLEGPWLSHDRRGAHEPSLLRPPSPEEVAELVDAGSGTVRMVTLAPELPGAMAAISDLTDRGVVVALGHTAADAATVRQAVDAGARMVTHLFNGMPPLHHREVSLPGVALTDERLWVELIADGHHVNDDAMDLALQCADQRLLLISDAMAATGLGDGEYTVAGSRVRVRDGVARLAEGDSLAGSTAEVRVGAEHLLARSKDAAAVATWTNQHPAEALGLSVPQLQLGDRADLVALSGPRLTGVLYAGEWLPRTS